MLALLTCVALGSQITGRIELPKNRPAEQLQIRFVQDKDDPVTLATSEVASDGSFRFDLEELPAAAVFKLDSAWLWLPGREQLWLSKWHDESEPYVLHAFLGTAIHGRVLPAGGSASETLALAGARVGLQCAEGNRTWSVTQPLNADITFAFDNLDPGPTYSIRLEQDGFVGIWQRVWGTAPGKDVEAQLRATPAARLRGQVFAPDGAPLAGVELSFVPSSHAIEFARSFEELASFPPSESERAKLEASGMGTITGPDGTFRIERAPALADAVLSARLEGFRVENKPVGALHAGEPRTGLDFVLTPHAELQITAVDEAGRAVPVAELAVFDPDTLTGVSVSRRRTAPPLIAARLRRDVRRVLLDLRCGDLVGFSPEPIALEDGKIVQLTITMHPSAPVCIEFPSRLQQGGTDDVRVFDEHGWLRTATLQTGWPFVGYPWDAHLGDSSAPRDALPGIRLAPLPAGRYTVKALDATGKFHSKTFDLDPRTPRSVVLNREE